MTALVAIDLGSPLVISYLMEAVGSSCTVQATRNSAPRLGRLAGVDEGRPLLEISDPLHRPPDQVNIQVPSRSLCFESRVVWPTERGWVLSYPFWLMGPERRRVPRVNVSLPVEVFPGSEGSGPLRGMLINISLSGVRLALSAPLVPESPLRLTFHLPGHPVPVRTRARVVWVDRNGEEVVAAAAFGVLSLQTEAALARFLSAARQEGAANVPRAE